MHKLRCDGIPLPELYVCDSMEDARLLSESGLPFIRTSLPDVKILKLVLFNTLKKAFPYIDWERVLGVTPAEVHNVFVCGSTVPGDNVVEGDVADNRDESWGEVSEESSVGVHESDVATEWREFDCDGSKLKSSHDIRLEDYCADVENYVNIDVLQSLGFLPRFLSDVADAIRLNIYDQVMWRECYNKKLGCCVGSFDVGYDAPNLIILDISGSIPGGISATMLQLIDSMRVQASADLIITGGTSMFWENGEELPSPDWIRAHIGYGNEATEFARILRDRVAGRHIGNVISFGDYDTPGEFQEYRFKQRFKKDFDDFVDVMSGTKIDRVMHYHTYSRAETGYARWVKQLCPDVQEEFDTSWCGCMIRGRRY